MELSSGRDASKRRGESESSKRLKIRAILGTEADYGEAFFMGQVFYRNESVTLQVGAIWRRSLALDQTYIDVSITDMTLRVLHVG